MLHGTIPLKTWSNSSTELLGDFTKLYDLISDGRLGPLLSFWDKLGLKKVFRRRFPTDDDFWGSPLSLVEVYRELKQSAR